ncbi:MAG: anthranilate phosphoribosyltransferase, partial [Gemmatimonadota bacterium]
MSLESYIRKLTDGESLTAEEAEEAIGTVMQGEASDAEIAGLLVALRARGASPSEVAGGVRALRSAMVPLPADTDRPVDTCGTGGGSLTTFNISTVSALVAAGAGQPVAKHGNRSYSSKCGSADVLEALGIDIEMEPERLADVFEETGFAFMFAPAYHPAMRHVAAARGELGFATIFNLLGPLTNPAGVERQVVGVADPDLMGLVAGALKELGHRRALVVHGEPGLDELSPLADTRAVVLEDGETREVVIHPEEFGWHDLDPDELAGGRPEENAEIAKRLLQGEGPEAARAATPHLFHHP